MRRGAQYGLVCETQAPKNIPSVGEAVMLSRYFDSVGVQGTSNEVQDGRTDVPIPSSIKKKSVSITSRIWILRSFDKAIVTRGKREKSGSQAPVGVGHKK